MAFISSEHWQLKGSLKCFINDLNNKESLQMYFKNCMKNYTLSKTEEIKIVDKTFRQKEVSLMYVNIFGVYTLIHMYSSQIVCTEFFYLFFVSVFSSQRRYCNCEKPK